MRFLLCSRKRILSALGPHRKVSKLFGKTFSHGISPVPDAKWKMMMIKG
jgi:hypothetical protein